MNEIDDCDDGDDDVMAMSGGNDYVMPHVAIVEFTCVVSVFICLVLS